MLRHGALPRLPETGPCFIHTTHIHPTPIVALLSTHTHPTVAQPRVTTIRLARHHHTIQPNTPKAPTKIQTNHFSVARRRRVEKRLRSAAGYFYAPRPREAASPRL